jgi:hypothetical protein
MRRPTAMLKSAAASRAASDLTAKASDHQSHGRQYGMRGANTASICQRIGARV